MATWLTMFASKCCKATVEINERGYAYCCGCGVRQPDHDLADVKRDRERWNKRQARRAKEQGLRDLGLTKVRGAQGGTYWE